LPLSCLIVSITKCSIVIGSPCTYLSRNRRTITWVSNYRYQMTFCDWTPVIGRLLHVNYAPFASFLLNVSHKFKACGKCYGLKFSKHLFLTSKFVIDTIFKESFCKWTSCRTIHGVIVVVILNRHHALRLSDLYFTRSNYSYLVCANSYSNNYPDNSHSL